MHILRTPRLFRSLHSGGARPAVPMQPAPSPIAVLPTNSRATGTATAPALASNAFFATVAHELRNAIAPLSHALEILGACKADPEVFEQTLPMAQRQIGHMNRLVGDMLDLGRALNDCIALEERKRQSLQSIVEETIRSLTPEAERRGRQLTLAVPQAPLWVDADAVRIAQSVTNLVSNAMKFTSPGGHIAVAVWQDGESACVSIADDGAGIPADQLESIFELFRQAEAGKLHRDGMGIGLALVRRFVELHGGTVAAHSAGAGLGSEFIVRLPISAPAAAAH